jgi:hypothetical protein
MKFRMTEVLRFWVECEYDGIRDQAPDHRKSELIVTILRQFEEAGDAMRYLDAHGRFAWKATPAMLTRLADAEQEAKDDLAECP